MPRSLFFPLAMLLFSLHVQAGQLGEVVPLAKDDLAAVAQLQTAAERHVLLYFGDHVN